MKSKITKVSAGSLVPIALVLMLLLWSGRAQAAGVTTYTSRSAWQAVAGTTTTINFSTWDNGDPITDPTADAFFSSLSLSGVEFLDVRSYWNLAVYVFPNQPLRANLPPGTVAFGADIRPFYDVPGSYTITLSTGDTFTYNSALVPWTMDFFGVVSTAPVEWVEFEYDNTYLVLDNFTFGGLAAVQTCVQPPDDLVSWWPGDNHPSDIWDGNSGTLVSGVTYDPSGMVGQAFKFTLSGPPPTQTFAGQYVNVPTAPNLDLTQVTVDAWIKTTFLPPTLAYGPNIFAAPVFIVDKSGPRGVDGYQLFYRGQHPTDPNRNGTVQFLVRAGGGAATPKGSNWDVASGITNVADGNWHHIAGTYNGQEIKVYVDGNLEGTTAYTGGITYQNASSRGCSPPGLGPLSIGRREWCGWPNGYYEGLIDEVDIFSRALTDTEIQAIFNADSAGKCI